MIYQQPKRGDIKVLDGTGEEPCILMSSPQQVIAKNTAGYALFG